MLPALNIRILKSSRRNIGSAVLRSTNTKTMSMTRPLTIAPITQGYPSPCLRCRTAQGHTSSQSATRFKPTANKTLPGMSSFWCCRMVAVSRKAT